MDARLTRFAAFAAALPALAAAAQADEVADFYKGRTVTMIVSAGAGGGYDAIGRTVSRHMQKHLPGNPSFINQNKVGAGGLVLANWMYNVAPKDGSVIGAVHRSVPTDPLLGVKGVKYDPVKFNWLGSVNNEVSVCVSWQGKGVDTVQDAMQRKLITGAQANTDIETFPIVLNNVIGTNFSVITGYPSGTAVNLAMERGEVNGRCGWSWSSVKSQHLDWVKNGTINILLQISLKKHPELPEVPLVMDFVKSDDDRKALALLFSRQVFGRPFFAPPGVPKARVAALRKAFDATMKDPAFIADIEKQKLEMNPLGGDEMQAHIAEVYQTPKHIVARAVDATKSKVALAKAKVEMLDHKGTIAEIIKGGRTLVFTLDGKKVKTKVSGSRTAITVGGKKAKRKAIRVGMSCRFVYSGAGEESKSIDCDG